MKQSPDSIAIASELQAFFLTRAERELGSLPSPFYANIRDRIYELGANPRPPGCKKLKDQPSWRIRIGNIRVIYEIDDAAKTFTVVPVGHRKDVYR